MSVERVCTGSFRIRTGVDWRRYFNVALLSPGPYKGVLELKAENKPFTLQRFRVFGKLVVEGVNPPPLVGYISWVGVLYLGRKGNEVALKRQGCGSSKCVVELDESLDVDTEFRGLGIQALRIEGYTGWWFDVDIYTEGDGICFELSWVG